MTSKPMIRIISRAEQHRGSCINDLSGLNGKRPDRLVARRLL
jgi:hypothetical protein